MSALGGKATVAGQGSIRSILAEAVEELWLQGPKRNNRIEITAAANHSFSEGLIREVILRANGWKIVLQQPQPQAVVSADKETQR